MELEREAEAGHRAIATIVTIGLFGAICLILRGRGARVVVNACLFVASLVATQLSVKVLVSPPYNYRFPGFVTVLHFMCVSVTCALYWICAGHPGKCLPHSIGSLGRWCRTVLPIALSQPVSVVFNNQAMVYIDAGVCAVIGTLSPVATAFLSSAFGRRLATLSWCGVAVAFNGALVIAWGEMADVNRAGSGEQAQMAIVTGLAFAFLSLFGRSIKIVIIDYLLAPLAYSRSKVAAAQAVAEEPLALLHVYVLTFPVGAVLSLAYALTKESPMAAWGELTPETARVLFGTCACALALNFLGGFVLRDLGASEQQIIGKLNTICSLAISVGFLGEELDLVVLFGTALVLGGVAVFEYGEVSRKVSASENEESESSNSSSSEDEVCK